MKKIILPASFFVMTPVLLFVTIIYYLHLTYNQTKNITAFNNATKSVAFAALPSSENVLKGVIGTKNSNVEIVRQFFAKYNSPLEPYAQDVVDAASEFNLDFKLIPAIAMQESNLCKKIPKDSYNCWGYGIYGKKVIKFDSYKDGIYTITKVLAKKYRQNGLETPQEIMTRYNPSNHNNWSEAVSYFMDLLK